LKKVILWLNDHLEEYLVMLLLVYHVTVCFAQVIMRYVVGHSLHWSEESLRYLLIWMVLIGISYGVKQEKHISIIMIFNLFGNKGKWILKMTSNFLILSYSAILFFVGTKALFSFFKFPQTSAAMEIPMYLVYAACPVGFALTSFRTIQVIVRHWKQKKVSESLDTVELKRGI
jgi:TRAP-type C4-dicarboxylate transport system permease small subunit